MKTRCSRTAAVSAAAFALALSHAAAGAPASTAANERYGSPADNMPYDREIRLRADTRSVGVSRYDTIRFVTDGGREFRWRFDTTRPLDVFPLSRIAPADVVVRPDANVYVNGEIPIAP
jgi:hypothetical protein